MARVGNLCAVYLLAAGTSWAAVCPVVCSGPGPHDTLLSDALVCAGPDGGVEVSGACMTRFALKLRLANQTLAGTCDASISRILPAPPPSFATPTAAIILSAGSSGTTVRDLRLEGAGDGIANTPASTTTPAGQPDDIRILGCVVRGGREFAGDAIRHLGMNGPPFNDIDRCTGTPAGIATGWVIDGNDLATEHGSGIVIGGSRFSVTNNRVRATVNGIAAENNTKSIAAEPFGSPPANDNNVFIGNVVEVASDATVPLGEVSIGLLDVGFPELVLGTPAPDRCDRGYRTRWEKNCFTIIPDGLDGRDHVVCAAVKGNGSTLGSVVVEKNGFTAAPPLVGAPAGNVGFDNSDAKFIQVLKNTFVGAGDFPFLSLGPAAEGNVHTDNKFGPGFTSDPHFVHDYGVAHSNCYKGNAYCEAHEEYEGDGVDLACSHDKPGTTCGGVKAPRCPSPPASAHCVSSAN